MKITAIAATVIFRTVLSPLWLESATNAAGPVT